MKISKLSVGGEYNSSNSMFVGIPALSVGGSSVPVSELVFTSQPQSKIVDEYALATFSCGVSGGVAPYTYQYKKNNVNIGTNSSALSFTAAATDKNASVVVTVTDSVGTSITSTAAVLSVTSYRYKLDGGTQYIKISPVASPEPSGVTLEFDAIANADADGYMAGGNQSGLLTWRMGWAGGILDLYRTASVYIDGVLKTNGQTFPLDGLSHHIKITHNAGGYRSGITAVGALYNADTGDVSNFSNSIIYNINPYNAARNGFIPLNNKSQGASQLATSGTINATIVNYTEAGWVVSPFNFVTTPTAITVDENTVASFSCSLAGGTYTYQWKKNGVNVGTNSPNLSFTAVAADKNALITVKATNSLGESIESTAVVLGVTSYKFSFDGSTQSALLASSITIPSGADFEMELDLKTTASCHLIADSLSGGSDRIFVAGETRLDFAATNVTTQFFLSSGIASLGVVVFKRVSGVLRAYNNGVELSLFSGSNVNTNSFRFNSIGGRWGSYTGLNPFLGTYNSVKLWVGGSRTTGTLALSTKLNNKTTGAAQASIAGPNATIQNYNASGWVVAQ